MKISFFAILGMIGTLAAELTAAAADGKVTLTEGIHILEEVCKQLGIQFDTTGFDLPME
jgi:hypothetical protein